MLPRLVALAVTLAAGSTVHADPITDFKNGPTVWVRTVTVSLAGSAGRATGIAITKPAGTLDFTLDATDLGLPLSVPIQLHGVVIGGGQLQFTVDDVYSPAIELGGGHSLSRVTGQLNAFAARLPATSTSRHGNVKLTFADSSYFVVHGSFGSLTIAVAHAELIGGIVQPPLESFTTRALVCSDTVDTSLPFTVQLTEAARIDAAPVALENPSHDGIRLPSIVGVAAGTRSTIVNAKVVADFVGTVRVTAAASGVTRAIDVVVRPRQDCQVSP